MAKSKEIEKQNIEEVKKDAAPAAEEVKPVDQTKPEEKNEQIETPATKEPDKKPAGIRNSGGRKPVKLDFLANMGIAEEKEYFIENFSMLLSSGTDIISSIEAIKTGLKSPGMIKVVEYIKEEVNSGSPLWEALSKTNMLPHHIITLIKIGEDTGRLAENLGVVVIQQQKERTFKSKVSSALMYPLLILALTMVIGIGIAWFILPKLSKVFSELNVELPAVTKALIGFGQYLEKNGGYVIPLFVFALVMIFLLLFKIPKTKRVGEIILNHFPVAKDLIREVEIGRMGFILGTLLEAGLPIVAAVNSLAQATNNHDFKKLYLFLKDQIEEGKSFQVVFGLYPKSKKLIPIPIQQMIIASEQSGRLAVTLLRIGTAYEEKTEITTKNLTVLLEPVMLVFVWLGVVAVAIAVILPIYSLVGKLDVNPETQQPSKSSIHEISRYS